MSELGIMEELDLISLNEASWLINKSVPFIRHLFKKGSLKRYLDPNRSKKQVYVSRKEILALYPEIMPLTDLESKEQKTRSFEEKYQIIKKNYYRCVKQLEARDAELVLENSKMLFIYEESFKSFEESLKDFDSKLSILRNELKIKDMELDILKFKYEMAQKRLLILESILLKKNIEANNNG